MTYFSTILKYHTGAEPIITRLGACGDDCARCPRYLATQSGAPGELARVKALWVALGLRAADIDAAELRCNGCTAERRCAYPELRACVLENGLQNCGQCAHYPCALVEAAFEQTDALLRAFQTRAGPDDLAVLRAAFGRKRASLDHGRDSCRK